MTLTEAIEIDIISGITVAAILAITTYLGNSWRSKKNENKKQKIMDNRIKEALISLAESFDNETQRLHPKQNIPLVAPKIERLLQNGDNDF